LPVPRPLHAQRDDHRAAGDAGGDHRAVAAAAVRRARTGHRLAGRARHHDHDDQPHDLLDGLRDGGRAVALATFDTALEEAAMDLGARPLKVFFVITLPIVFPAILSGWLLAFTLSWDDLVISSFTSGPGSSTLPMVVFSKVRLGVSPEINVLATLTVRS
jgi:hypothetical protein